MHARFFSHATVVACLFTSSVALAQENPPDGAAENCAKTLSGPAPTQWHTRTINVRELQPFRIGGEGWARPFLTTDNQVLIGIIDPQQRLNVFDVYSHLPVKVAVPTPFDKVITRGEWSSRGGRPMIHLGDTTGGLHHFGVGPQTSYDMQHVGYDTPVFPLAVTDRGVLVGMPNWGRVRIMPLDPMVEQPFEINVPRFLRAAHLKIGARELIATISEGMISAIDLSDNVHTPQWHKQLATNGANATLSLFKTTSGEPALVAIDGGQTSVYMPFTPRFEPKSLPLAGVANFKERARALTTSEASFVVAPGSEGTKMHRFNNGVLQPWTILPLPISHDVKSILLAPNERVYIVYTEKVRAHRTRLNIAKVHARQVLDPVYDYELEDNEVISDTEQITVSETRQIFMVRTNLRVIPFEITPQARD